MARPGDNTQNQVLVIDKAARLLEQFRSSDTLTLGDLSERLQMSKSTVHRLLSSLEQVGFIQKETQPGSYRLGLKLFELGSLVQARLELRQVALPYLSQLVAHTGETAFLSVRDGVQAVCIERVEGSYVQSLILKVGGALPLHAGGGARCLLAYSPEDVLDLVLSLPRKAFTPFTIVSPDALQADTELTRSQGCTFSYEDVTIGVAAVAVPIFDHRNIVVGALSLSGITPRWTEAHIDEILSEAKTAARHISLRMGWRPTPTLTSSDVGSTGQSMPELTQQETE